MLNTYRILSYLLLPVALLTGITTIAGLMMALGSLAALLPAFLSGATTIYIITSFMFLQRVVEAHKTVRHSLHDWVRANGFVALFFGSMMLVQSIALMNNPSVFKDVMEKAAEMQKVQIPPATLMKYARGVLVAMSVVSFLLLVHIGVCFRLLKRYAEHFE